MTRRLDKQQRGFFTISEWGEAELQDRLSAFSRLYAAQTRGAVGSDRNAVQVRHQAPAASCLRELRACLHEGGASKILHPVVGGHALCTLLCQASLALMGAFGLHPRSRGTSTDTRYLGVVRVATCSHQMQGLLVLVMFGACPGTPSQQRLRLLLDTSTRRPLGRVLTIRLFYQPCMQLDNLTAAIQLAAFKLRWKNNGFDVGQDRLLEAFKFVDLHALGTLKPPEMQDAFQGLGIYVNQKAGLGSLAWLLILALHALAFPCSAGLLHRLGWTGMAWLACLLWPRWSA